MKKGLIVSLKPDCNRPSFASGLSNRGLWIKSGPTHWPLFQAWISRLGGQMDVPLPEGTCEEVLAALVQPMRFSLHSSNSIWEPFCGQDCAKPSKKELGKRYMQWSQATCGSEEEEAVLTGQLGKAPWRTEGYLGWRWWVSHEWRWERRAFQVKGTVLAKSRKWKRSRWVVGAMDGSLDVNQ